MADEMKKNIYNEEIELDALEDVSGGATLIDPGAFRQLRFMFNDDEVKVLKDKKGISLQAYRQYCCSDLSVLGGTASEIKAYLNSIGISVQKE